MKATRNSDFYMTVTERKRRYRDDGSFEVEKHKIFLYREDFEKFTNTLMETIQFINEKSPEIPMNREEHEHHDDFSEVRFEDLDK